MVGSGVGCLVGSDVGFLVGSGVGFLVGCDVGSGVGSTMAGSVSVFLATAEASTASKGIVTSGSITVNPDKLPMLGCSSPKTRRAWAVSSSSNVRSKMSHFPRVRCPTVPGKFTSSVASVLKLAWESLTEELPELASKLVAVIRR